MEKVCEFFDKLKFSNKDFETLGLLIQGFAGLMLFFVAYAAYALLILGSSALSFISIFSFGAGGLLIALSVIMVLVAVAYFGAYFLVGKKARQNYNKPEEKENLRKTAILFSVLVGIYFLNSLRAFTLGNFIFALVLIFLSLLYHYFVSRIEVLNQVSVPSHGAYDNYEMNNEEVYYGQDNNEQVYHAPETQQQDYATTEHNTTDGVETEEVENYNPTEYRPVDEVEQHYEEDVIVVNDEEIK